MYADDICLIADDADNLRQAIMAMDAAFLTYGLTVSLQKTKILVGGKLQKMLRCMPAACTFQFVALSWEGLLSCSIWAACSLLTAQQTRRSTTEW